MTGRINLGRIEVRDADHWKPPWCYITREEAARFLDLHPNTLYRWQKAGLGPPAIAPATKFRGNRCYYLLGEVIAWRNRVLEVEGPKSYQEVCQRWMKLSCARFMLDFQWDRPKKWRKTRWHRQQQRKRRREEKMVTCLRK